MGGFPAMQLGAVTGGSLRVEGKEWGNVADWKESYDTAIGKVMASQIEAE